MSTRRVDELVQAMGVTGISKSTVSKLCRDIDERVNAFLERKLDGEWPYLWLDATYLKQREGGRIVSGAAIIAVAVNSEGRRQSASSPMTWATKRTKAIIRLIGAVLMEANDEWQIQNRYMQTEPMAELLAPIIEAETTRISTAAPAWGRA